MKYVVFLPLFVALVSCSSDPQAQAQRYVENGNKFFEKEKFKEASIMYRRAIQKDQLFGEAYYRLGLTDLELAAFGDAVSTLRRAVELQPTNADALTKLADLFLLASTQNAAGREELLGETRDLADRLIALDAESYDGHRMLGQIALLREDAATAVSELAIANRVKPGESGLVLVYYQALIADGQAEAAERIARELLASAPTYAPMYDLMYRRYVGENRIAEAEALMRLKVDNNPDNGSYVLQMAAHYYAAGKRPLMDEMMERLNDEERFPNGHLLAGDFYFLRLREFQSAETQYQAGVETSTSDQAIYRKRLVELFAATNRSRDANEMLQVLLDDDPTDADAVAMRAALRLNTGEIEDVNMAVNDLQALVTKTPDNHLLRFNLARALIAKGEVGQARLQLEEAVKIRTDFVVAHEMLARIYLMASEAPRALQQTEEIIKLDPQNLSAHLTRSSALLVMQENEKAREELDWITETYPQNAEARYQVGYLAWQDGDFSRASQVFGDLYKSNPKDLRGLVGVVETLASQGSMDDAIQEIRRSLQAEPERQDLKIALANLYVRSQRYDDAIASYQTVLDKDPDLGAVLFRLAETYRRKGDLDIAIDTFRKASLASPNDPAPLLQLGLLMDGTGRREQAKPIYEQILKIQPDHPIALNNLAYIKAEEGVDLDQALTMAQRARQKLPESTDIADTLGWIYIKKNLSEDAIRVFTDLIRRDPNNPSYRYHFGMALMQKGDRPQARRELEAALQRKPSREEEGKITELLSQL